jgi:hypothetical protein
MICRGPGFLAVVWLAPRPSPFPPPPSANCLSLSVSLCVAASPAYWRERRGGGGGGAESYNRKEAWPSIIVQSTLLNPLSLCMRWIVGTEGSAPSSVCVSVRLFHPPMNTETYGTGLYYRRPLFFVVVFFGSLPLIRGQQTQLELLPLERI